MTGHSLGAAGGNLTQTTGTLDVGAGGVGGLGEVEEDQVESFAPIVETAQAAGRVAKVEFDAGIVEGAGGKRGHVVA